MDKASQENLFYTIQGVIQAVIEDKKKSPKNREMLKEMEARINLGLQVEDDFILWVNFLIEKGDVRVYRGRLNEYDLELIADPEDLMYFSNGRYSTLHMLFKKNRFGNRKLQANKGTTGRNLGLLLKLPKILVLD
jgi:hypothetical protein